MKLKGKGRHVCASVCVCVRVHTCVCTYEMREGTGRKSAWRLKEQVGAGRDGPGENTEAAAPMGVESRGCQECVGRSAKTQGDAFCRRQGSLTVKDLDSVVLLLWLTPSPRLGGLKEVASPL